MENSKSESSSEGLPQGKVPDPDAEAVSELLRRIGEGEIDPQELLKHICHEPDSKLEVNELDENQISTLADTALDKLEHTGDVTHAASLALSECEREVNGDRERVIEQVTQKVNEILPDQFEYDIIHHTGLGMGIAVKTGCPHCGHDKIFNGSVTHSSAQFVAMTVDENELQNVDESTIDNSTELCFIDDGEVSIDHITCGLCGAALAED